MFLVGWYIFHEGFRKESFEWRGEGESNNSGDGFVGDFVCVWAVLVVFSILAISMARSKNTGKGKATSSSMERAVKKRKADMSQTMKKGKGKQKGYSSESEEESESEDEEIEALLLNPRNPSEKSGFGQLKDKISTMSRE